MDGGVGGGVDPKGSVEKRKSERKEQIGEYFLSIRNGGDQKGGESKRGDAGKESKRRGKGFGWGRPRKTRPATTTGRKDKRSTGMEENHKSSTRNDRNLRPKRGGRKTIA